MKLQDRYFNTTHLQENTRGQSKDSILETTQPIISLFAEPQIQICQPYQHRISLILPDAPSMKPIREKIAQLLSLECGGCTSKKGEGNYQNWVGKIDRELITEITASCTNAQLRRVLPQLEPLIIVLLTDLEQETVFFSLDGEDYLLQLRSPDCDAA